MICDAHVGEVYDDGYINMAPSGAAVKPFVLNGRNGNCKCEQIHSSNCCYCMTVSLPSFLVPPPPGVNLRMVGESTDDSHNLYDRIPADRNSKGDNVYDEINLQGAKMLPGGHVTLTPNNGTYTNGL